MGTDVSRRARESEGGVTAKGKHKPIRGWEKRSIQEKKNFPRGGGGVLYRGFGDCIDKAPGPHP